MCNGRREREASEALVGKMQETPEAREKINVQRQISHSKADRQTNEGSLTAEKRRQRVAITAMLRPQGPHASEQKLRTL